MPERHPYVNTQKSLIQVITHFRKSFPATVNAETLKKLGFAPSNESYVLNVLRHLNLIDDGGAKTDEAARTFNLHEDSAFQDHFGEIVKEAYSDLFELHGEGAWTLDSSSLISFFRNADQTTAIVGRRQAATFSLLSAFSGHSQVPDSGQAGNNTASPAPRKGRVKAAGTKQKKKDDPDTSASGGRPDSVGLTVRVEINLPAGGDQQTYDHIFRSIRENLLNDQGS